MQIIIDNMRSHRELNEITRPSMNEILLRDNLIDIGVHTITHHVCGTRLLDLEYQWESDRIAILSVKIF